MNTFLNKVKQVLNKLTAYFPTSLPRGMAQFDEWAANIISSAGMPDNDSVRFSLAVMVLHLDSTTAFKPRRYFIKALLKAASNQVVSEVINGLKAKQEAAKLAASQKPAEATALHVAASDGPKQ